MGRDKGQAEFFVEVWFGTGLGYVNKAICNTEDAALREARGYWSDSRGVRVIRPDGSIIQVKPEARLG